MVEVYENGGESAQKPRDRRTPACGVSMWLGHLTAWLLVSGIDFSKKEHFEKKVAGSKFTTALCSPNIPL